MIRKILIGILIVVAIAVAVMNYLILGVLAVGVWIYLLRMVQKQGNSVSNDQVGSIISEIHLKRIKTFLIVGAFSFLVFIVSAIVHNVSHGLSEIEDSVFLIVSIVALIMFVAATAAGLFMFLKGRRKTV